MPIYKGKAALFQTADYYDQHKAVLREALDDLTREARSSVAMPDSLNFATLVQAFDAQQGNGRTEALLAVALMRLARLEQTLEDER